MIIFKKHKQYDEEAKSLLKEVNEFLKINATDVDIYHFYQFKNDLEETLFESELFDERYGEVVRETPKNIFLVKDYDGQYIQTQDLVLKYLKTFLGKENDLRYYKGYDFKDVNEEELKTIKKYLINEVVQKEINFNEVKFDYEISSEKEHQVVEGFNNFNEEELKNFKEERYVGLDIDDLMVIQEFYKKEDRDPNFCEIKMLDAYWSDHCRHTTFLTKLEDIEIEDGEYADLIRNSWQSYLDTRKEVYKDKEKNITLMDLATINMRELKQKGLLNDMEKSDEVNACSIELEIDVDGKPENWLHVFKNETHNHPTEIEPYGGAHTCIGGGVRDPLSGRAKVLQGMRIVGAGNPLTPFDETLEGKLAQRYLALSAMNGFSDYENQIGAPVGIVKEFYDDGFVAKRMELGALVAAAPKASVTRENASAGDVILLLGAPTGRDGLGAAVGSSSMQTEKSLKKAGAEVQKGNPFAERKIIRLFNNHQAAKLIKKCNDFGAGGVSVAIGELADGLDIYLDEVYTKYPGLNGYEIALSESQERMAVVIAKKDLHEFEKYCQEEDVRYAIVAEVTDNYRLVMKWHGKVIMDISRDLLNSNGATKQAKVKIETNPKEVKVNEKTKALNNAITTGLSKNFDTTLGRNRIFVEYGGKYELTAQDGIVTKFPVEKTNAVSIMTYGYYPELSKSKPYHGGYYAVLQSIVKNIAISGKYNDIRLSMQEFFPAIKNNPTRMGLPVTMLLGAYEVMKNLSIPAIGGKDSMSGTFKDIDVPPTLVCFAINASSKNNVVSRELKNQDSKLYITKVKVNEKGMVDFDSFKKVMEAYQNLHNEHKILAASAVKEDGVKFTVEDMALGNAIKFELNVNGDEFLPGNIVFEVHSNEELDSELFELIGKTNGVETNLEHIEKRTKEIEKVYEDFKAYTHQTTTEFKNYKVEEELYENNLVVIPVVDGATGESDLHAALENEGFEVEEIIVRTNDHKAYKESLKTLSESIDKAGLVAIPHGDYFASVIKNVSGVMCKVLNEPVVSEAMLKLRARDGFIIGVGAGMAALIDCGYFGELKNDLVFRTNHLNKYLHTMQDYEVVGSGYYTDDKHLYYSAPISGRNITIICGDIESLREKINILAVSLNNQLKGDCGIDAISTKDQHVFGVKSLVDRMSEDLYQNLKLKGMPLYFKNLSKHFKKGQK